jgi:phosphate transport system ATP-binding protein
MDNSPIIVEKLSASYGEHQALKDITVNIPKRQLTVIMGPSGCGKTTLLKTLNRLVDLAGQVGISGKVLVDGINVLDADADLTSIRKRIGLIAQAPSPLPMSIYDNVAYGPRIHGTGDRKELDKIVENCLQLVGLWDEIGHRLHEPASRLSVGQQQRLCLARTIAVKPEIILCDEPTSALDPVSARKVETQLLILKNYYTVIFVTHSLSQARRLADYVIFLYLGELVEHGPANVFFTEPRDPRTKAYLQGAFG